MATKKKTPIHEEHYIMSLANLFFFLVCNTFKPQRYAHTSIESEFYSFNVFFFILDSFSFQNATFVYYSFSMQESKNEKKKNVTSHIFAVNWNKLFVMIRISSVQCNVCTLCSSSLNVPSTHFTILKFPFFIFLVHFKWIV